jgi:hypothetical protein
MFALWQGEVNGFGLRKLSVGTLAAAGRGSTHVTSLNGARSSKKSDEIVGGTQRN